jgi:hypothetical protein
MSKPRLTPKEFAIQERQGAAFALRKLGGTYAQIARAMRKKGEAGELKVPPGYDDRAASRDVYNAIQRWATPSPEEVEALRLIWQERLEEIFSKIYPLAKRGDLFSIDRVLVILNQEAKLNPGLFPKDGSVDVNFKGQVGVGGVDEQGEVAGPVVVRIEWPDVPNDNVVGFADPSDPATAIEISKMLKGALGNRIGDRCAEAVLAILAGEAARAADEAPGSNNLNDQAASEIAAMLGAGS